MEQKIKNAVIIMAGMGTRALPATKAVAKELFPVGNKPALLYLLEECLESGIKDVVLVISKRKKDVKKFLSHDVKLENLIADTSKEKLLDDWKKVVDNLNIKFVYQGKMNGSAGAVYSAKKFVKNQPFLLITADDLCVAEKGALPASAELIQSYNKTGKYTIGAMEVPNEKVSSYGIIVPGKQISEKEIEVLGFKEKPKLGENPSNMASLARYVVLPSIFDNILKCEKHQNGEVFFPEAIAMEIKNNNVIACKFGAKYYDLGNNLEFIKCTVEQGLKDKNMQDDLSAYIKGLAEKI